MESLGIEKVIKRFLHGFIKKWISKVKIKSANKIELRKNG